MTDVPMPQAPACRCGRDDNPDMILCEAPGCGKWYHFECDGLTQEDVNAMGENPYICASCDVPPDPNAMKKTGNIASMKTKTPKKENRVTVAPRLKKSLGKEKKKLKMLASEFDRSPLAPVRQAHDEDVVMKSAVYSDSEVGSKRRTTVEEDIVPRPPKKARLDDNEVYGFDLTPLEPSPAVAGVAKRRSRVAVPIKQQAHHLWGDEEVMRVLTGWEQFDKQMGGIPLLGITRVVARRQTGSELRPVAESLLGRLAFRPTVRSLHLTTRILASTGLKIWYISCTGFPRTNMFGPPLTVYASGPSVYRDIMGRDFVHNASQLIASMEGALLEERNVTLIAILNPGKLLHNSPERQRFNDLLELMLGADKGVILFSDDGDARGGDYLRQHMPLRHLCVVPTGDDVIMESVGRSSSQKERDRDGR